MDVSCGLKVKEMKRNTDYRDKRIVEIGSSQFDYQDR